MRIFDRAGDVVATHPLLSRGDGLFTVELPGLGPGTLYKFVLDGREVPDPYARFLPAGVHGPAEVIASRYEWRHGAGVERPLAEHVIYELHVGTFSAAGTYRGVCERLPYLSDLGVSAIELMPVAAFPGTRGWGYDGVAPFAPFAPYGTPDELRALVDEAHGVGLAVFLDVVYNHFGPSGNYLPAYRPEHFTQEIQNAWGDALNFADPGLRQLVIANALSWLTEFRFDGLRLDAIHAIIDPSPRHILRELSDEVSRLRPVKLLIGEDDRNDPAAVAEFGLAAVWADDFHHAVRVALTHECDGYYAAYSADVAAIADAITSGWLFRGQIYPPTGKPRGKAAPALSAEAFVYCIQNHDQVGNRAHGDRLSAVVPLEAHAAVSALLLFLPMTPLLFMGQEWAARTPFQYFTDHDHELGRLVSEGRRREFQAFAAVANPAAGAPPIPDPQAPATFAASKLDWSELDHPEHARVLALYRQLLHLRRSDPVLAQVRREGLTARALGSLLMVKRSSEAGERLLLVNFSPDPVAPAGLGDLGVDVAGRPRLLASFPAASHPASIPGYGALILGS